MKISNKMRSKLNASVLIIMLLNLSLILNFGITIATVTIAVISALFLSIVLLTKQCSKPNHGLIVRRCRDGLLVMFIIWMISFTLIQYKIVNSMNSQNHSSSYDYIIILGAAVRGEEPSLSLQQRLDKTLEVYRNNPGATYIVSGGQGPGEDISEAEAMRRYLVENGIPDDQILKEDHSTSTAENIEYTIRLMGLGHLNDSDVLIITSDYHLYRALKTARSKNLFARGVSSVTPYSIRLNYMVREYYAVIKYTLFE